MIDPIGKLTEKDWWDLIFANDESQDDPDLRLGFACWLQDECDDPGAGYLWWCLDTSPVNNWYGKGSQKIRHPRNSKKDRQHWWFEQIDNDSYHVSQSHWYHAENQLPKDVIEHLQAENNYGRYIYDSRRAAEEDALRAWRRARASTEITRKQQPAGR